MATPFDNFSDPTTAEGRKLWELATKPLSTPFDGSRQSYQTFIADIRSHFKLCKWMPLVTYVQGPNLFNLVDNPGLISLESVVTRREQNIVESEAAPAADDADAIATNALAIKNVLQASMMYMFLLGSICGNLKTHIASKINQFFVVEDGPTLLKYIMNKVKGRASQQAVRSAREALHGLDLKEFKFDIARFNDRVRSLTTTIVENNQTFNEDELVVTLLRNYKKVDNEEFRALINTEICHSEKTDKPLQSIIASML